MQGGQVKTVVSVAILLVGLVLTVITVSSASSTDSSSGIIIDFGDYEVSYSAQDESLSPIDALENACGALGYELQTSGSDVLSIDGRSNTSEKTWSLYVVESGSTEWTSLSSATSVKLSDYTAVCYGYCGADDEPAPAVDETGYSIYGHDAPSRIVSLAPSCTETICAVGGLDSIVATDQYSDYPSEVPERQSSGEIAIVGGFTNPSYEKVLQQSPDLVVCISTQNAHLQMAEKLRAVGIRVLVLDGGESIDAVLDNIYMTGVVLENAEGAAEVADTISGQITEVSNIVDTYDFKWEKRVMVALSAVQSPWVSGSGTYVSDVMSLICVSNIYDSEAGWVQVNAETIIKYNPEVIIVVSSDYEATQEDYDSMLASMSEQWKGTDAYKNGNIYLFTGEAADCASRAGPRVAELTELLARAIHGEAFSDGVVLPKYVGDDYTDYLTIARSVSA
ncbi:MAG: helical backbone metal receptor [Thermoplasmata archaeon]|nr:helical backbone metal receptor [Thermoplasmata archaeon]